MTRQPVPLVTHPSSDLETALVDLIPALSSYFVRRLDNREDAADAVSETLVVLWRRERSVPRDDEGRRRYAFGVARNVLAAARRGRIRHHALSSTLLADAADDAAAELLDLDLRAALAAMSERDREIVLLVAWEGFGVAEAGAVLGLKPDAARARYSRARARLRAALRASADPGYSE